MAPRRGKFGQGPKAAPDLTSTLISIANTMRDEDTSNIVSAWKSGGTFEGKPVTDQILLSYFKGLLSNVSKDDPAWDKYNNLYVQYQYAIAESNATLKYTQAGAGKNGAGDQDLANFYLTWAKKFPANSDMARTLQTDAAKFLNALRSASASGAAASKQSAYTDYANGVMTAHVDLGAYLTSLITAEARVNNLVGQTEDLSKLAEAGQNDPGRLEAILTAMKADPNYASWVAQIKQYDPTFSGNITSTYFAKALADEATGYGLIHTRAVTDGYATNASAALKSQAAATALGAQAGAWDTATAYEQARAQFSAVWNNPNATDADKASAAGTFAKLITGLAGTPGLDAAMSNRLLNDAAALRGDPQAQNQPSFYEDWNGLKTGAADAGATQDTTGLTTHGEDATFAHDMSQINGYAALSAQYPGQFAYAPYKVDPATGNRVYDPTSSTVGLVSLQSVNQSTAMTTLVPVSTLTGQMVMEAVTYRDVVVDDGGKGTLVGHAITYNQAGNQITLWQLPNGKWSTISPFASNVQVVQPTSASTPTGTAGPTADPIHLVVQMTPQQILARAQALDATYHTNLAGVIAASGYTSGSSSVGTGVDANGNQTKATLSYNASTGRFTYSATVTSPTTTKTGTQTFTGGPTQTVTTDLGGAYGTAATTAAAVYDASRNNLLQDSFAYSTPAAAALDVSGAGGTQLSAIGNDPLYRQALLAGLDPNSAQAQAQIADGMAAIDRLKGGDPFLTQAYQSYRAGERDDLPYSAEGPLPTQQTPPILQVGHTLTVPLSPIIPQAVAPVGAGAYAHQFGAAGVYAPALAPQAPAPSLTPTPVTPAPAPVPQTPAPTPPPPPVAPPSVPSVSPAVLPSGDVEPALAGAHAPTPVAPTPTPLGPKAV